MKTGRILGAALMCAAFSVALTNIAAEKETATPKKETRRQAVFMKQKLAYSQLILEGLTLEKYDLIITNGMRMWNMSKDNLWQQLRTEEYQKHSQTYRDNVLAMIDAARGKKIDSAREAYGKALQSCYDCHKYFSVEQRAKWPARKTYE